MEFLFFFFFKDCCYNKLSKMTAYYSLGAKYFSFSIIDVDAFYCFRC